ncbi:SDR family NAD(P)-dependent oxidoreductase [Kocuria sp. p3-SID1433]|uniref:SDR family NAD(P)-dependent oxidoreductase n=1 Tax=unclassified Kocuria TaxID=2649579 RepID=UPI0021A717BB|nr:MULTISPECIES: SDR family NAD(P)-dependent oxidoreductase [unclassified Kocuria]MCT1601457.1 SDR family NAD(P)-dependent oxidoreductase [Kocuria sp. p3-SID1428]MCT2180451.1 SDR family NAD(P)-dependent oxidoreductase [Kocuria sp. p3-SID1433]
MMTALITGGTSGIGSAFAEALARRGFSLVLVARGAERLESTASRLRTQFAVEVETLEADLSVADDVARVAQRLEDPRSPIDMLINNAGFSVKRTYAAEGLDLHHRGIDVMAKAVLDLSSAAARAMTARGEGWILNVSSTSGEVTMGPYSALKAWCTTYTESLAVELQGTGVRVMALLPGWVRTEFHARAGISGSSIPDFLWLQADDLVEEALKDLARGRVVSIPTLRYKAIMLGAKLAPRAVVRKCSGLLMGSRANETPLAKPAASGATSRARAGQGEHA